MGTPPPEAMCFAQATEEYRKHWRLARKLERDLARGYGLHESERRYLEAYSCYENGVSGPCFYNMRERVKRPYGIDRDESRARLQNARAQMARLRPAAEAAARPCGFGTWSERVIVPP